MIIIVNSNEKYDACLLSWVSLAIRKYLLLFHMFYLEWIHSKILQQSTSEKRHHFHNAFWCCMTFAQFGADWEPNSAHSLTVLKVVILMQG